MPSHGVLGKVRILEWAPLIQSKLSALYANQDDFMQFHCLRTAPFYKEDFGEAETHLRRWSYVGSKVEEFNHMRPRRCLLCKRIGIHSESCSLVFASALSRSSGTHECKVVNTCCIYFLEFTKGLQWSCSQVRRFRSRKVSSKRLQFGKIQNGQKHHQRKEKEPSVKWWSHQCILKIKKCLQNVNILKGK